MTLGRRRTDRAARISNVSVAPHPLMALRLQRGTSAQTRDPCRHMPRAKRVLIVEDNYDNRAIYTEILRYAGYEVSEAMNGREGFERARLDSPELILMDLSMPVETGWEALSRLKADPGLAHIPVLALSAHVLMDGDYQKAIRAGFAGYITKPVEPKRVLQLVRATIGPPT